MLILSGQYYYRILDYSQWILLDKINQISLSKIWFLSFSAVIIICVMLGFLGVLSEVKSNVMWLGGVSESDVPAWFAG